MSGSSAIDRDILMEPVASFTPTRQSACDAKTAQRRENLNFTMSRGTETSGSRFSVTLRLERCGE